MTFRDSVVRTVEFVMGQKRSAAICSALAKIGLRGLGVNLHYDLNRSGELFFLDQFLRVFPESVCFDVGANVGEYSEALIKRGATRVVAFEPAPSTFEVLKQRVSNHESVQLVNAAVGEMMRNIDLDVPRLVEYSTLASRDIGMTAVASDAYNNILVKMTTLDAFVADSGTYPDFVKIDVEGFELEVLLGMRGLLSSRPPKAIQFEFNQHHLKRRQCLLDFSEVLKDFSLFRLATRSMRPLDPSHYLSNIFTYCNIVAVHRSCGPILSDALC